MRRVSEMMSTFDGYRSAGLGASNRTLSIALAAASPEDLEWWGKSVREFRRVLGRVSREIRDAQTDGGQTGPRA
jgi:hypothetical protein